MNRWGLLLAVVGVGCSAGGEKPEVGSTASAITQGPWSVVNSPMPPQLSAHAVVTIDDTHVTLFGGINALGDAQDKAYLFTHNPSKHTFDVKLAGKMVDTRFSHTANKLPSGKILLAGGEALDARSTAELIDPGMLLSKPTGSMKDKRTRHGSITLADGKVMVFGGKGSGLGELSTVELYDPATESFSDLPAMGTPRIYPTATLLKDGKILVVGGSTKSTELFDPTTKTWSKAGDLSEFRVGHVAVLLASGKVLVAGGFNELTGPSSALVTASAEIYDPATKAFTKIPNMPTPRGNAAATLFPSGLAMVTGGRVELTPLNYVDVYDEKTNTWASGTPMVLPHALHTATLMPNQDLLITGSAAAEVYTALPQATSCVRGPDCASGFCVDGVCCNSACTGSCERCDTGGNKGTCSAVSGAFNHCAPGNTCIQNACVPSAGTTCSADRLSVLDKDGKATSCSPYSCDNSVGMCSKACVSSVDCAPGYLCGNKQCVAAPASDEDSSGCTASPRSSGAFAGVSLLALAVGLVRRRRLPAPR